MLKEKLGLCPYKVICDEKEFILMPEIQDDIEEFRKENEEPKEIKNSEEPKEIKSPKEDENMTDWYDKNKFKKILDVVCGNKFNHKNKIGKFKYKTLKTWLIILTKIQLVKHLLKKI